MFYALPLALPSKRSARKAKDFEFSKQLIVQLAKVTASYYGAFQTITFENLVINDVHLGVIAR